MPTDLSPLLVVASLCVSGCAAVLLAHMRSGDLRHFLRNAAVVLLAGALLCIAWLTVPNFNNQTGAVYSAVNLTPGAGISLQLGGDNTLGLLNVVGNLVLFAPVGLLAPVALRWRPQTCVWGCLVLSVIIEAVQYAGGRVADIDDVLLNTAGAALGASLWWVSHRVVVSRRPTATRLVPPVGAMPAQRLSAGETSAQNKTSARTRVAA